MTRTLFLAWALTAIAGSATAQASEIKVPNEDQSVRSWMSETVEMRAVRLQAWRQEASDRLADAERAVWASELRDTRVCREDRRDAARQFVDLLDRVGPDLIQPDVARSRRVTAARVLVRAWHPIGAIEPDAPCQPDGPADGGVVVVSSIPADGLADLPEPIRDDPLTLGFDPPNRRTLRR